MPGFARGQFMVDYEQRCDLDALRRKRVEKAQQAMKEQGVDAVFVWKVENTRYLSSLRASFLAHQEAVRSGVLLTQRGRPHIFVNGGEIARITRDMPWIDGFHSLPKLEEQPLTDKLVTHLLRPLLQELGVAGGRLAIDAMTFTQYKSYSRLLPGVELVDGNLFMHKVRRIKLPEEIYMIREACAIADAVNQEAMDNVKAGRRECDVAAAAMKTLHHYGGEMPHLVSPFVASGEHMSPPTRFATDKI
ncbi:MAG: aminopeptidase P family N-terminal domain-containing protein, partial [Chloroflexota bacterium]